MAERVASYGSEEHVEAGQTLFERGQRSVDFFLMRQGRIDISDFDAHGAPHFFTQHGPHLFTGELDLFKDRTILLSARAGVDSLIVRVKRSDFRRLVVSQPDIGELMMRNEDGFIRTGKSISGDRFGSTYATSRPGVFAVGDVRSGSVKRVAFGVGEGLVVIHCVHQFLNPDLV